MNSALNAAPMAMLVSDGRGMPPIITFALPITVAPNMGPTGGSLGLGALKMQCLVMSTPSRPARLPSIHTFADPRNTSYMGKKPPQNTPSPMSPHRAAGIMLMSVLLAPLTNGMGMTGPVLGRGTGTGLGGIRLGGCMCACGNPTSMSVTRRAGNAGNGMAPSGIVMSCSMLDRMPNAAPTRWRVDIDWPSGSLPFHNCDA